MPTPDSKPVDLAYTKAEIKEQRAGMGGPTTLGSKSKGPQYPWGLTVRLDEISMKKLGMDDLPEVGELCQVTGLGRIVSVSQRESTDSESKSVEIQIEKMNLAVQEESAAAEAAEAYDAFDAGAKKGRGKPGGY